MRCAFSIMAAVTVFWAISANADKKSQPTSKLATVWGPSPMPASFAGKDAPYVRADSYMPHPPTAPMILLFHQAGWSRGEYREIAPRLNELGFNAIAIDQRSGGKVGGVVNETHEQAVKKGRATDFVSALADMRAAVEFVRKPGPRDPPMASGKLILWGSSYSASLALILAAEVEADAVLAFSPGEYFTRFGKPKTWVRDAAEKLTMPVFITSARAESAKWKPLFSAIPSKAKTFFLPKTKGNHGSRALWKKFSDSGDYWKAVVAFLAPVAP